MKKEYVSQKYQLVLAGNPNCGKSTIFNQLTGARQHVGNYPGVTVEKMEGRCSFGGRTFSVVDLPGTYSLEAHSEDEEAARRFLLESRDASMILVNVIDASNFERSLFLTLQLRQLGVPMILVLNMVDLARKNGLEFQKNEISKWLRVPVLECVGFTGEGIEAIRETASSLIRALASDQTLPEVPAWLNALTHEGTLPSTLPESFSERFQQIQDSMAPGFQEDLPEARPASPQNETELATLYFTAIARLLPEMRSCGKVSGDARISTLDRIFLHRYLGLPFFFLMLYLVFQLTFTIGEFPMGWIEGGVEALSEKLGGLWPDGSESLLKSLLLDGILGGVGGVIVFLPNILLLFLAISLLEDSGYLARAAVLTDRFMAKIGLHGKSFIPMLIGFGCSVPAIMATRTLENRRERLATMFVIPLMSCGARLPIYALLIPAFFPGAWQGSILFLIYASGILLAVGLAKLLSLTVLKGEPIPFVMELPPWHVPTLRTVGMRTLERGWLYLKKAGTIILGISVVLWALTTFPQLPKERAAACASEEEVMELALEFSGAGRLGKALEPLMKPMGLDWKIGTAFLGAFAAKEVFVAQMGIICRAGDVEEDDSSLREILRRRYSPLAGLCILIFSLVASPCMATFAVMAREAGSWKWAFAQWFGLTFLGWLLATGLFQIGTHVLGL